MGKALPFVHQQCTTHGLHLAVTDVMYRNRSVLMGDGNIEPNEPVPVLDDDCIIDDDINFDDVVLDMDMELPEEEEVLTERFQLKQLIDKVREVVYTFKGHPVRMTYLLKHVMEDHGKELGLIADCKTRWNSTHDMIERIMFIRGSVAKALVDLNLHGLLFTDLETESLRVVSTELTVIKDTLKFLCARSNNFLTMDAALTEMLNAINVDSPFGMATLDAALKRIRERRTIASGVLQYLQNGGTNQRLQGQADR